MNYRKLTIEELQELEDEFVKYLVINSITADDWVKIKDQESEKAERIIELFSDAVFEKILQNTRFLDYRSSKQLFSYQCLDNKMVLVGMTAEGDSDVDFSDPDFNKNTAKNRGDIKVFTTEKEYTKKRELELFNMIQNGCEVADGKLFKNLCLAL